MNIKLLTEHHLGVLSLKGGCTGSSESTLVKMSHCWKSYVTAQMVWGVLLLMYISDIPNNHKITIYCHLLLICLVFIELMYNRCLYTIKDINIKDTNK